MFSRGVKISLRLYVKKMRWQWWYYHDNNFLAVFPQLRYSASNKIEGDSLAMRSDGSVVFSLDNTK